MCRTKTLKYAIVERLSLCNAVWQYAIGGVSCDSVFHVKMLAHPQICLTEFSSSVMQFRGSDRGFYRVSAIERVSCDLVFHVKMLAHLQIRLTEFSLSVARFGGFDRGCIKCRAIRGLMRRGLHNPKFV